jgi:Undecaprenyl-phosphate glucose phosphotransferase
MISYINRTVFNLRLLTLFLPLWSFMLVGGLGWERLGWERVVTSIDPYPYFGLLVFATVAWSIAVENCGLCTPKYLLTSGGNVYAAFLATLMTFFAELLITFFYRATSFSRVFVSSTAVIVFLSAVGLRVFVRTAMKERRSRNSPSIRVLVVGADQFARRVANRLVDRDFHGLAIAGFVRLPDQKVEVDGTVYELESISDMVTANRIDDVVLALPAQSSHHLSLVLEMVQHIGVPVRTALDLGEQPPTSDRLLNINGVWMVNICHTPTESVMYMILKRGFDIAFSLATLFFIGPLMLAIAAAIKLTSPGPVFFAQSRVGFKGNIFKMYKFRTMRTGSVLEGDTLWTTRDDSRRTRIGSFLRRTSLDELPQFFNVLKGDMSVVGPRPERPYFVEKFAAEVPRYGARHNLKVGITGWAQVNGWRGDTCIQKRVEHDLYYLQNWSLLFDLRIVLRTVIHLNAKHAY